jgi:hypothetical protein
LASPETISGAGAADAGRGANPLGCCFRRGTDPGISTKGFGTGTTQSFASNVLTLTNGANVATFAFSGTDAAHFSLTSNATETLVSSM